MCCARCWTTLGALLAGLAVTAGAFGAHGLSRHFAQKYGTGEEMQVVTVAGQSISKAARYLEVFQTAARYQMYHALGLIAVGLLGAGATRPKKSLQLAGWSFALGIVLFSGSLYALTLTGAAWWGMVTPLGGALFIIGWIAMAVAAGSPESGVAG